ncbi:MAG: ABC-2 family transporter protein [Planctomycetes bacterium]|nr:ABC-2 family transporter protein [Planctomycetota bacterium]
MNSAMNPTPMLRKTFKLFPRYMTLSLIRTSEFKFSFYSYMLLYIVQLFFYVFFWRAVSPPVVSGWTTESYYILTGFVSLNVALQEIFWATGIIDLMILRGDLLVVLARPENSFFGLVMRRMGAMAFIAAFLGFMLIITALFRYFDFELWRFCCALFSCLCGAITMRAVLLCVNTLSFWYGRVTALKKFVFGGRELARTPLDILPHHVASFLTFFFPVMLIACWPSLILVIATPMRALLLCFGSFAITCLWIALTVFLWKKGLKRYEGVSL